MVNETMNDVEIGVIASTWKWRLLKAGYKTAKDFCKTHNIPDSQFSLWVNGEQKPMAHNVKKVQEILKNKGV